jgi:hypothetical protein
MHFYILISNKEGETFGFKFETENGNLDLWQPVLGGSFKVPEFISVGSFLYGPILLEFQK